MAPHRLPLSVLSLRRRECVSDASLFFEHVRDGVRSTPPLRATPSAPLCLPLTSSVSAPTRLMLFYSHILPAPAILLPLPGAPEPALPLPSRPRGTEIYAWPRTFHFSTFGFPRGHCASWMRRAQNAARTATRAGNVVGPQRWRRMPICPLRAPAR